MRIPIMVIKLDDEHKNDKYIAHEIAHNIEMLKFYEFEQSMHAFYESYKEIKHPDFKGDIAMINDFEKFNNAG